MVTSGGGFEKGMLQAQSPRASYVPNCSRRTARPARRNLPQTPPRHHRTYLAHHGLRTGEAASQSHADDARFRVPVLDVIAAGGGADKLTSRCAGTPRD